MNERIQEIVKETVRQTNLSGVYIPDEFVQRFAELIVRECGEVAFQQWCDNREHESAQSAILNYFGVK